LGNVIGRVGPRLVGRYGQPLVGLFRRLGLTGRGGRLRPFGTHARKTKGLRRAPPYGAGTVSLARLRQDVTRAREIPTRRPPGAGRRTSGCGRRRPGRSGGPAASTWPGGSRAPGKPPRRARRGASTRR